MKWILNLDRRSQSCRLFSRSQAFFRSLYVTSSSESLAVYLTSCQSYTSGVPATGLACPTHTWSMRCLSLRHATPGAVVQQCLLRQKTLSPATFVCPRCSPRISPILHVLWNDNDDHLIFKSDDLYRFYLRKALVKRHLRWTTREPASSLKTGYSWLSINSLFPFYDFCLKILHFQKELVW